MVGGTRKQDKTPRVVARKAEPAPPPKVEPALSERNFAPRGISFLLASVVRPVFRKRSPAAAHLMADWDSIAGPQLAALATPVKFSGGTLTLACTGPAAIEMQHVTPQIIARLNQAVGQAMVERLRFVSQVSRPGSKTKTREAVAPIAPPADLPEGPLGEALAKLYQGLKP